MVVSSALHESTVTGVGGVSNTFVSQTFKNRLKVLNNVNVNKLLDPNLVTSTTSASLLSNGFFYGNHSANFLSCVIADLSDPTNKKKINKKKY